MRDEGLGDLPCVRTCPLGHRVHAEAPASEYLPLTHS